MKKAAEIYEGECNNLWFYIYSYQPMLDDFGEILVQVDDNDYQGDSRVFYRDAGKYGYLQFGWGSCSGCDSLQACDDIDEVQNLMDGLRESIKWFDSADEALKWFTDHDWEGDYHWNVSEQRKFVSDVIKFLEKEIGVPE